MSAICSRARSELAGLESEREPRYVSAWPIARTYAVMGHADNATRWVQVALEERTPMMLFAAVHAAFGPIRTDARFAAMLGAVGRLVFAQGGNAAPDRGGEAVERLADRHAEGHGLLRT